MAEDKAAPIDTGKLSFPFKDVDTSKISGTKEAWKEVISYLQQIERRMHLLSVLPGGCAELQNARTKIQEGLHWIGASGIISAKEKSDGS